MSAEIFKDGDQVKIGAWVSLSTGVVLYFSCPVTDPVWTQHNEDVLKGMFIQTYTEYDAEGNAIVPIISSVTAEHPDG